MVPRGAHGTGRPYPQPEPLSGTPRATGAPISWQPGLTYILVFAIWSIRGQGGQARPGVETGSFSGPRCSDTAPQCKDGTTADPT